MTKHKKTASIIAGLFFSVALATIICLPFYKRSAISKNVEISQEEVDRAGAEYKKDAYKPEDVKKDNSKPTSDTSSIVSIANPNALNALIAENSLAPSQINRIANTDSYRIMLPASDIKVSKENESSVSVRPNHLYKALVTPNDPFFNSPSQWHLNKVSAPAAWDITRGSGSVKVAVVDTGFALNHQDLASKWDMSGAYDFYNNDNDPTAGSSDISGSYVGHGTLVAGLVAAATNNNLGVASLGWDTKLIPIQAMGDNGSGDTFTVSSAIYRAVDKGAQVINLSLGGSEGDDTLLNSINYAINNGVTVVAAAGNDGCDCINYPANYPQVIAVGASDTNDNKASFSSYGSNLDVVAPGSGGTIASTFLTPSNQTSSYGSASGTSISTPIVSAAAALIKSARPISTPSNIEAYLRLGADKVSAMSSQNFTKQYGYGRLNVKNSLAYATSSNDYRWQYAGQTGQTNLTATQKYSWTVYAKNIGKTTWLNSGANPIMLGTSNARDRNSAFCSSGWFGCNRAAKLNESSVEPGSVGSFTFTIQAPSNAGNYSEYYNLVAEGFSWFNDPGLYYGVTVNNANFSSALVSSNLPTQMTAGQVFNVILTVKNTGNVIWYKDGKFPIYLGTYNPTDRNSSFNQGLWGSVNRPSPMAEGSVAPNENATFNFSIKAPATNGNYAEYYSLVAESLKWFNQPFGGNIQISGGTQPPSNQIAEKLSAGQSMISGQELVSPDGRYKLIMQSDGNLVIYSPNRPIWSTGTNGKAFRDLAMQSDGNLVLYGPPPSVLWSSGSQNRGGNLLVMQNDGNLVIYTSLGRPIWSSGTNGKN